MLPNAAHLRTFPKISILASLVTSFDHELDTLKKCIADEFDARCLVLMLVDDITDKSPQSLTQKATLRAPIAPIRDATLVIDQLDPTFR
jgi:hypothetical protein